MRVSVAWVFKFQSAAELLKKKTTPKKNLDGHQTKSNPDQRPSLSDSYNRITEGCSLMRYTYHTDAKLCLVSFFFPFSGRGLI